MTLLSLFWSFLQIGLFSIGGGYAAIPLIRAQTVELHRWLTAGQFMNLAAIAEMTPGPIAVNAATFAGMQVAGLPGALAATAGCVLPSLVIVSLLSYLYSRWRALPALQGALQTLRPAVAALILAAGLQMLLQAVLPDGGPLSLDRISWLQAALAAAAFLAVRRAKWSPILTMALCGAVSLLSGLF